MYRDSDLCVQQEMGRKAENEKRGAYTDAGAKWQVESQHTVNAGRLTLLMPRNFGLPGGIPLAVVLQLLARPFGKVDTAKDKRGEYVSSTQAR